MESSRGSHLVGPSCAQCSTKDRKAACVLSVDTIAAGNCRHPQRPHPHRPGFGRRCPHRGTGLDDRAAVAPGAGWPRLHCAGRRGSGLESDPILARRRRAGRGASPRLYD